MENQTPPTLEDYQRTAVLRAAVRHFLHRGESAARRAGLTPQRQQLLLMIKGAAGGNETATVTELADRMCLAQSTVTELVSRAEAVGLLVRGASERDGRVSNLRLTPEGERRLEATVMDLRADREALMDVIELLRQAAADT